MISAAAISSTNIDVDEVSRAYVNTTSDRNTTCNAYNHTRTQQIFIEFQVDQNHRNNVFQQGIRRAKRALNERVRKRLSKICCACGVLGTASGGSLFLVYIIAYYTQVFNDLSNLQVLSIPGVTLFFSGFFALIIGIIFCWIWPQSSSLQVTREDETEAGFSLPGIMGYHNQALVFDAPPSYTTLAIDNLNVLVENLPSYEEAIKIKLSTNSTTSV